MGLDFIYSAKGVSVMGKILRTAHARTMIEMMNLLSVVPDIVDKGGKGG